MVRIGKQDARVVLGIAQSTTARHCTKLPHTLAPPPRHTIAPHLPSGTTPQPHPPHTLLQESKGRLAAHPSVVPQLVALLQPGCGEHLQSGVLRLLHNLSFDATLRQQMLAAGLVQQVSHL